MQTYKNVIYILTNPSFAGYIKIGYASDLKSLLASLNTGVLSSFRVYAVYETPVKNADLQLHAIIDDLAPIVRAKVVNGSAVHDKEFFKLDPEQAYKLLKYIAIMTGTENKLHRCDGTTGSDSKKPAKCLIGSLVHPFASWKDSIIWQCETIEKAVGFEAFKTGALSLNAVRKQKTFSEDVKDMNGYPCHKFADGDLYLKTHGSAAELQKISKKLESIWPAYTMTYQ